MDSNKELVIASETGDLETVKQLLAKGADASAMGPNSGALHCAASNGHREIVRLLLENGSDPNIADNQSFYPIHLAAAFKRTEIVQDLIDHGAKLDVVTSSLGTLLHVAAANDFYPIFDIPQMKNAPIEARDHEGKTAFNVAAAFGSYWMGRKLFEAGAKVDTVDDNGYTPLLNLLSRLDDAKIEHWQSTGSNSGVDVKYEIKNGCFRYIKPFKGGADELGRVLSLRDQYDISFYDWGPTQHRAYVDCIYFVEYLVKKGADVNFKASNGNTPMIMACSAGDGETIAILAKKGADFNVRNEKGTMPLHYVSRTKRLDGLKAYFKHNENADANVLDAKGWTAGHYLADMGGHAEMAKLLIKNGLDVTIGSTQEFAGVYPIGVTAKAVAEHWNDDEMATLMTPKKDKTKV
ncbi:ankyrin repeat domain-containing protein [Flavobacterium sp.]|uniref:ankyrin repeat domain-containing protein n=1 Tax=Flavobacterium sp. TaxID=239 RepID=UPI001216DCAC|nr:ankyrin repeat domain-containing protein [Flavobacterium sp.]RZJ70741.1 MAG: ankyrin repeat domain-containing protein [Flavobacterium sp.]